MDIGICNLNQKFGENANTLYSGQGFRGHPGIDISCGYGTPVHSPVDGIISSLYQVEHPASDGYTMIAIMVQTGVEIGEFIIGHVSEIDVKIGDTIIAGQIVGKEGNKGPVYSGNGLVTLAQQAAGNHEGAHRHYQWRVVGRKTKVNFGNPLIYTCITHPTYLETAAYRDSHGYYYELYDHENGYAGCTDWSAPLFQRNLYLGSHGYDVILLQRALINYGATFTPNDGWFGPQTLTWLMKFQEAHGLISAPVCGPQTRAILNTMYPCVGSQFIA